MITNNRKEKMQTDKDITKQMFDSADAIHKVSRTGQLYGKQEKLLKAEIEREEQR
jgi:hypothetical protein